MAFAGSFRLASQAGYIELTTPVTAPTERPIPVSVGGKTGVQPLEAEITSVNRVPIAPPSRPPIEPTINPSSKKSLKIRLRLAPMARRSATSEERDWTVRYMAVAALIAAKRMSTMDRTAIKVPRSFATFTLKSCKSATVWTDTLPGLAGENANGTALETVDGNPSSVLTTKLSLI
ncbi:hypothetical protein Pure02_40180 [Paenarthrobacter ureafaciens]|nr:hypothetical protein Pure02_40180 [Paenarthrobacter ureafaciens]